MKRILFYGRGINEGGCDFNHAELCEETKTDRIREKGSGTFFPGLQ
jgi:hypothetical protein